MTLREWFFQPLLIELQKITAYVRFLPPIGEKMSVIQDQIDATVTAVSAKADALERKVNDAAFELREISTLLKAALSNPANPPGQVDLTALNHIGERLDGLTSALGGVETETDPTPATTPGGEPVTPAEEPTE